MHLKSWCHTYTDVKNKTQFKLVMSIKMSCNINCACASACCFISKDLNALF